VSLASKRKRARGAASSSPSLFPFARNGLDQLFVIGVKLSFHGFPKLANLFGIGGESPFGRGMFSVRHGCFSLYILATKYLFGGN
jgi:hypothetical protein